MNKLITTNNGGMPVVLNDLRWLLGQATSGNAGIYQALNDILLAWGTDFIIYGCTSSGSPYPTAVTEGWIMLNSEILKVDAQVVTYPNTFYTKVTTYDTTGNKSFESGTTVSTYQVNRGVPTASSGTLECTAASPLGLVQATAAEAKAQALNTLSITPYSLGQVTGSLVTKVVTIGDWNMSAATGSKTCLVAHGVSDFRKIRTIQCIVRNDADTGYFNIFYMDAGTDTIDGSVRYVDSTNVHLQVKSGGYFTGSYFQTTSYNRGWVTIQYSI
jgi:hypothetical protein